MDHQRELKVLVRTFHLGILAHYFALAGNTLCYCILQFVDNTLIRICGLPVNFYQFLNL